MEKRNGPGPKSQQYFLDSSPLLFILVVCGEFLMALGVFGTFQFGSSNFLALALSFAVATGGSAYVFAAVVLIWNNIVVRPREGSRVVHEIPWGGDELVADVQCGRGIVASGVASRLTSGMVVGIDAMGQKAKGGIWRTDVNSKGPKGAEPGAAHADPRSLPLRSESFDVVISGFGKQRFRRLADRIYLVDEMLRILKPGGTISMLSTGDPRETEVMLKSKGLRDVKSDRVKAMLFSSARVVTGRKLSALSAQVSE